MGVPSEVGDSIDVRRRFQFVSPATLTSILSCQGRGGLARATVGADAYPIPVVATVLPQPTRPTIDPSDGPRGDPAPTGRPI